MTPERIRKAEVFSVALGTLASALPMAQGDRARAAAACFGIARDHHGAIVLLMKGTLYSSSFALLRCLFEAYLRGLWLKHCASNAQVIAVLHRSEEFPRGILADIETMPDFSNGVLSRIKRENWRAMCDYTHTGGLHLQRWQCAAGIEPVFEPSELEECLNFAELFGAMATLELVEMSEKPEGVHFVQGLIRERWP